MTNNKIKNYGKETNGTNDPKDPKMMRKKLIPKIIKVVVEITIAVLMTVALVRGAFN